MHGKASGSPGESSKDGRSCDRIHLVECNLRLFRNWRFQCKTCQQGNLQEVGELMEKAIIIGQRAVRQSVSRKMTVQWSTGENNGEFDNGTLRMREVLRQVKISQTNIYVILETPKQDILWTVAGHAMTQAFVVARRAMFLWRDILWSPICNYWDTISRHNTGFMMVPFMNIWEWWSVWESMAIPYHLLDFLVWSSVP